MIGSGNFGRLGGLGDEGARGQGPVDRRAVATFRRELRRAAADFLALRTDEAVYLAKVRRAAVAAGLLPPTKGARADRILQALAWGGGSVAPGTLPQRLEADLAAFDAGSLSGDELRRSVASVFDQLRRVPSSR